MRTAGTTRADGHSPAAGATPHYELRLYVAGTLPNSVQAEHNLRAVADELLRGRHTLEVVDFLKEPQRALGDGVLVTPTLLKLSPPPRRTIIGTLSDRRLLLRALDLEDAP